MFPERERVACAKDTVITFYSGRRAVSQTQAVLDLVAEIRDVYSDMFATKKLIPDEDWVRLAEKVDDVMVELGFSPIYSRLLVMNELT